MNRAGLEIGINKDPIYIYHLEHQTNANTNVTVSLRDEFNRSKETGVSKTQTSKTQTSDPKNSDPLGVSKTQTLKTQTLWVSRKLRPEKLRPSGCLENSDPKDKTNLDSECQRMLQAVLFTVRRYLNVQRK